MQLAAKVLSYTMANIYMLHWRTIIVINVPITEFCSEMHMDKFNNGGIIY